MKSKTFKICLALTLTVILLCYIAGWSYNICTAEFPRRQNYIEREYEAVDLFIEDLDSLKESEYFPYRIKGIDPEYITYYESYVFLLNATPTRLYIRKGAPLPWEFYGIKKLALNGTDITDTEILNELLSVLRQATAITDEGAFTIIDSIDISFDSTPSMTLAYVSVLNDDEGNYYLSKLGHNYNITNATKFISLLGGDGQ